MDDLQDFTLEFLSRERRQVQRKDGFQEFLTPEVLLREELAERYKAVTFDCAAAIRNPQAEFFAIGHPFVDAMLRHIGNYEFGGHTAVRVINRQDSETHEVTGGFQFNFTVRRRVAREDGDEHLFDFHTVVVRPDGHLDGHLAELAAKSYSSDESAEQPTSGALKKLDLIGVDTAFESARAYLEKRTKLWDWDEEVDLIGVAKVVFAPADA